MARPASLGLAVVVAIGSCAGRKSEPAEPARSWTSPRAPVLESIPGTTGLSAASCGSCHAEIYKEWSASTHAHAWVDRQFQAELNKDQEVAWLCINCHTPLANQQAELTRHSGDIRHPDRRPNPAFDPALQQEGVTCLSCHWRPEGIASVHEDAQAPHPLVYSPELRSEKTCTGCHQAVARLEDALVCTFNTGAEWAAAQPGKTCPECHMPAVTRASAPGAPARAGGRHSWPGSLIPKDAWSAEEAAVFADWQPGPELVVTHVTEAAIGSTVPVSLTLTNARAGHMLPSGDPERYLELRLTARDADGEPVFQGERRVGQTWEWWPKARKLADNRLAPGQSLEWSESLRMPAGGLTIEVELDHVRISPENAAHHDLGDYPQRRRVRSHSGRIRPVAAGARSAP